MQEKNIICIGAALMDESYSCYKMPIRGTSNPADFYRSIGGVACNIAHHLALLQHPVELITCFGNDADGEWLKEKCRMSGIGITHSVESIYDTGRYMALLSPSGELFAGAMSGHFDEEITPSFLLNKISLLKKAALIQLDCNLSAESLNWLLDFCRQENIPCVMEPVSTPKAERLKHVNLQNVLLLTPNSDELAAISGTTSEQNTELLIQNILQRGVQYLWIRKGKNGSGIYSKDIRIEIPALKVEVTDITGAGDAAMAGWIHAWLNGKDLADCVRYGHSLATIILQVKGAIDGKLNIEKLENTFKLVK